MVSEYNHEKQQVLNLEYATNPQPGDYWEDMFCPVLLVLEVKNDKVTIVSKTKEVDQFHWSWDFDKVQVLTVQELIDKLSYSYDSGAVAGKKVFWACGHRNTKHSEDVEEWLKLKKAGKTPGSKSSKLEFVKCQSCGYTGPNVECCTTKKHSKPSMKEVWDAACASEADKWSAMAESLQTLVDTAQMYTDCLRNRSRKGVSSEE